MPQSAVQGTHARIAVAVTLVIIARQDNMTIVLVLFDGAPHEVPGYEPKFGHVDTPVPGAPSGLLGLSILSPC